MTKTPIITILIPLYNGVEFLENCLKSIESQSYVFWKILIGINGYEQNSVVYQIVSKLTNHNQKIKVVEYSTKGKPDTLNEMIKDTFTTDLICILDVDDWWASNKLAEQMKVWNTGLWDVVGTLCYYVNEKTKIGSPNIPIGYIRDFYTCNPMINSSILMKKEDAFWTNEFFGLDDYELWLRLFHQGKKFCNIPYKLTYHRIHKNSAYNSKNHINVPLLLAKYQNKF